MALRAAWQAMALVAVILVIWACAGDAPKNLDLGSTPPLPAADQGSWPDSTNDTWPSPGADSYAPAPFGCRFDEDCFGRRCCATPWGANLCADSCQ